MKKYLKPRYLVSLFFVSVFLILVGMYGYGRSLGNRDVDPSSFSSYLDDMSETDRAEKQRLAFYSAAVGEGNESLYVSARKDQVALLDELMIGAIYLPSIDTTLPVSAGTGNMASYLGVVEPRQTQRLGEGLWLGASLFIEGKKDYLLSRLSQLQDGDVFYVSNGETIYPYEVERVAQTHSIIELMNLNEILDDGQPRAMLYKISEDANRSSRGLYDVAMGKLIDEPVPDSVIEHMSGGEKTQYNWFQDLSIGLYVFLS